MSNEAEWAQRNKSASSLYAALATLPAPLRISDITLELHNFVGKSDHVIGATLFDASGRLIAQFGTGNDTLTRNTDPSNTATIPIKNTGSDYGRAVLAFRQSDNQTVTILYYITLAVFSLLLAALPCGLLLVHTSSLQTAR